MSDVSCSDPIYICLFHNKITTKSGPTIHTPRNQGGKPVMGLLQEYMHVASVANSMFRIKNSDGHDGTQNYISDI